MKFLFSEDSLLNSKNQLKTGNYSGILLRVDGTNNASQTLALTDVGDLYLMVNGKQRMYFDADFLSNLNNLYFGRPSFSSAAGAAFSFSLFIPFYLPGRPNAFRVSADDDVWLGLNVAGTLSTVAASWQIEAYGVESSELENYILQIAPAYDTPGGAGKFSLKIAEKDIQAIFIKSSVINRIELEVDGDQVSEVDYDAQIDYTSLMMRVESAASTWAILPTGDTGLDMMNEDVQLFYTATGAGTVYAYVMSFDFDEERHSRSINLQMRKREKKIGIVKEKRPGKLVAFQTIEINPKFTKSAL